MHEEKHISWTEVVGLIDGLISNEEPRRSYVTLTRTGLGVTSYEYCFILPVGGDHMHEGIILTDTFMSVQMAGYNIETGVMNPIEHIPAYRFQRCAGGLCLAGVVFTKDGSRSVPLGVDFKDMLHAGDVIYDVHGVMLNEY
jgi:hypothetical protein